ncbi:MAG: 2'-5' RNA ligase family protein [Flavisolibacter sp.]|nr:2'-5' RNA ligase family protein [Flavisolibacter sp.]
MERQPISMPGYRINEYRLVVPLPETVQEKVTALRKSLHQKHKVKFTFGLKPCLTLLKCHAFEKTEARLVERLQQITMSTDAFKVELEGFAAYPSHTIYINVLTKAPFRELVNELKRHKKLMHIPQHDPHFISEPHLIVAQKLKPMQFINMWLECEHAHFSGRFVADALLLLRRTAANQNYEVVRRLEFMSLPMNVKQGVLFS